MSECDWLSCSDPEGMLELLKGKASPRKLRLFAIAALRRVPALLVERGGREAVEVAERFADAQADKAELRGFWSSEPNAPVFPGDAVTFVDAYSAAYYASVFATGRVSHFTGRVSHRRPAELTAQANLLRDIFGNPLRAQAPLDITWNASIIRGLAQAAYNERLSTYDKRLLPEGTLDPDYLAVLADALEESGCTDITVLEHLRSPGPHVRGCHALDHILGRTS